MILYPAIDLKEGKCVRLLRGDMQAAKVFSNNPAAQAKDFVRAGCDWLHLVDLNGAFEGQPVNGKSVTAILKSVDIPVQLGGGIRDMHTIEMWLSKGVKRIILGTIAVENPGLVRKAAKRFNGKIAVGLDAHKGVVATHGWAQKSNYTAIELAKSFEDAGVCALIYTDIERDGIMQGPNIDATSEIAQAVNIPVIASGGISSLSDLEKLRDCKADIGGAIVGRALYDGAFTIEDALQTLHKNAKTC